MPIQTARMAPVDLVRLMVGTVFLSEGIQKFLFPAELGPGRFARIGIPRPPFSLPKLPSYGLWSFLHEARTDWCMFLGCLAIVLARTRPRPRPQGSAS